MITFPKIKAAGYAIGKRLQGYHLLKNPKGTPQTEVNMLKTSEDFSMKYFDDYFKYKKITKNFADREPREVKRTLDTTHYFDVDKKQMTKPRKKDARFAVYQNGSLQCSTIRKDMPFQDVHARKEPKLSTKPSDILYNDSEYDQMCKQKLDEAMKRRYYKTDYSLLQKIASFGLHRRAYYPQECRPNFFKVLYENLTNKA